MNAETYDDLKQYVGSKNDFTSDLINMGYTKGKKDGYNQALEDFIHAYYKYCEIQYGILADDELVDMLKIKEKLIK